jgi:hypothetical protein
MSDEARKETVDCAAAAVKALAQGAAGWETPRHQTWFKKHLKEIYGPKANVKDPLKPYKDIIEGILGTTPFGGQGTKFEGEVTDFLTDRDFVETARAAQGC